MSGGKAPVPAYPGRDKSGKEKIKMAEEKEKNRKSSEEYLERLKKWLQDTADTPLEEMSDFFHKTAV